MHKNKCAPFVTYVLFVTRNFALCSSPRLRVSAVIKNSFDFASLRLCVRMSLSSLAKGLVSPGAPMF